ncbi:hypothetical protein SCOR_28840 [Sulfidibacter corallicola]|uniref:Uncharacterized protein n=1 Tax=Sulfidibacter corallicola TaxID=2818388 RepID=A0A8A4TKG3_SULCO|nr:hypothetical protein [Sulfidibacter corallicola]QTD50436.1 hypothetical protein J3U87_33045 [Sulfidibacter corallicola]
MIAVLFGFVFFWLGPTETTPSADVAAQLQSEDDTCLILRDGRFEARLEWQGSRNEEPRQAQGVSLRDETGFDETGYFFFDDPEKIEAVVRVFDGCQFNDNFWVFAGGLTNVAFTLTVTDTQSGEAKEYTNPLGKPFAPIQDTNAFSTCPAKQADDPSTIERWVRKEETLTLHEGRFTVDIDFEIPDNRSGKGTVGVAKEKSGAFWFLDQSDFNVYVTITDGRPINGHFWLSFTSFTGAIYSLNVTDTVTGVVKSYRNELQETSFGTDYFLTSADTDGLLYPWVSDNDSFNSVITLNNNNCIEADVTLEANRGDGQTQTVTRTIPPNGFLEEAANDLFPELSGGSGYSVLTTSSTPGLLGRWVTNNLRTPSQSSPSQGVAVQIPNLITKPLPPNARVGQSLQFGFLPLQPDFFAGSVVVNVGDAPTDVTLYFYAKNGELITTDDQTIRGLEPFRPFAAISQDLVPNRSENIAMIAHSESQPLTGVSFIFNQDGEPSIGNAEALDFVPPPQ